MESTESRKGLSTKTKALIGLFVVMVIAGGIEYAYRKAAKESEEQEQERRDKGIIYTPYWIRVVVISVLVILFLILAANSRRPTANYETRQVYRLSRVFRGKF